MEGTLGVVINAVEKPQQVAWCLDHLRMVYKDIPVVLIADGPGLEYDEFVQSHSVRYVKGERLKVAEQGGRWWLRTLLHGLSLGTDYVLKVDPDTKFHRRIESWPHGDIAGTIAARGGPAEHIQGGAQLFTRSAIIKLLESGYFHKLRLREPSNYAWSYQLALHCRRTGYLCTDAMLAAAKRRVGLTWCNWKEVFSLWRGLPINVNGFALTHPHKNQ